jgi:glutamine synthetase
MAPLEAADALVFTRETIFNVAAAHGLRATLAPRVFDDSCAPLLPSGGTAAHMHISLHTAVRSAPSGTPPAPSLSAPERAFLASVLAHFPALAALLLPTPASYARVQDGLWTGGTHVAWGTDNREAPVRLCGAPGAHNFELKLVDGTASPYAVLAGVVGVGARGVREGAVLEAGDCARPASEMSAAEREALGVRERVPRSVGEARAAFRADAVVREVLGGEAAGAFLAVNEVRVELALGCSGRMGDGCHLL